VPSSVTLNLSLNAVWLMAVGTLALVALLVLGLLLLRYLRWRSAFRQKDFEVQWRPVIMRCAMGDGLAHELPHLRRREQWLFMKLWIHCQMSLRGECTARLAELGMRMGCDRMAREWLDRGHWSQRLFALLALGYLQDPSARPLLEKKLAQGSTHTALHAGWGLLQLDARTAVTPVVDALLEREDLDVVRTSVLLKQHRLVIQQALKHKLPQLVQAQQAEERQGAAMLVRWLRLARAMRLQVASSELAPMLTANQAIDVLIGAIRLVQGEQGSEAVRAHAGHADWRVRAQVARALGYIGGTAEIDTLFGMLSDAQWWVRYRAAQSLVRLSGADLEPLRRRMDTLTDRYARSMVDSVLAERAGG
jgi:HEAT repeat protein